MGQVPYQAFAFPDLGWTPLGSTPSWLGQEVSSSAMSSRLSCSTAPLVENKSSATFLLDCFLVVLSYPPSAPAAE